MNHLCGNCHAKGLHTGTYQDLASAVTGWPDLPDTLPPDIATPLAHAHLRAADSDLQDLLLETTELIGAATMAGDTLVHSEPQ